MEQTVLMPVYMKDFACSGSDCRYTCCNGWRVDIDQNTLKKYKHHKNVLWRDKFNKNIIIPAKDGAPVRCRMLENGDCAFLTDSKLCSIQKELGAGFLSYTCRIFPRGYNSILGVAEKWGSLGCPEIIKSLLLSGERLQFIGESARKALEPGFQISHKLNDRHPYAKKFYMLRRFSFFVLQNAGFSIAERLLILAYFFDNFNDESKIIDVDRLTATFEHIINSGEIREVIREIRPERKFYYDLLRKVLVASNKFVKDDVYFSYYERMGKATGLAASDEKLYFEIYDRYYRMFLQKHPFILENYLVNAAFIDIFPLQRVNMWESFMMLVVRYMIINFLLMGLAAEGKADIDEAMFLECFCSISRILDATETPFTGAILDGMKKNGESGIIHAFYMIKI